MAFSSLIVDHRTGQRPVRCSWGRVLLTITILATSACASDRSGFVERSNAVGGGENGARLYVASVTQTPKVPVESKLDALDLDDPANTVLLIYNHGSRQEFYPDRCEASAGVPQVVRNLSGRQVAGKRVLVYAFCTPSRVGEYRHQSRTGEPKVAKRARDIENLVQKFTATGLPSENIFLVGHSAGAWASLLVSRRGNVDINAVIGFAPAFAGPIATRSSGWWDLRRKQSTLMRTSPRMDALVFAFDGDPYYELSELGTIFSAPGTEFVPVTRGVANRTDCRRVMSHRGAFTNCFEELASQRITAFIQQRLRNIDIASVSTLPPPQTLGQPKG